MIEVRGGASPLLPRRLEGLDLIHAVLALLDREVDATAGFDAAEIDRRCNGKVHRHCRPADRGDRLVTDIDLVPGRVDGIHGAGRARVLWVVMHGLHLWRGTCCAEARHLTGGTHHGELRPWHTRRWTKIDGDGARWCGGVGVGSGRRRAGRHGEHDEAGEGKTAENHDRSLSVQRMAEDAARG